ncbi:MAG: hypothetical protein GTO30_08905 [Acidobacteria bacterium]|nr:hypothetical protein [Acidobacteriota bacterium]NIN71350.1 hypothetical protein [Gemmatimonadota bacterium]NIP64336.1 hypothetical protein [Gammaproteobacteria bacterium]NIQ85793.1 hypothetical protein [Acidobacteriota bacterium]
MPDDFKCFQDDPSRLKLLKHADGIHIDPKFEAAFKTQAEHDPADLDAARAYAVDEEHTPIGLLYRNPDNPCYDDESVRGIGMDAPSRLECLQAEIDRHLI